MNNERNELMSNEPNKPIEAEELTEKELKGIVGGMMGGQATIVAAALVNPKLPTGQRVAVAKAGVMV